MKHRETIMHFRGLLTGVLFVILLLGSLLLCRYTNSFGSWLPYNVLAYISAIAVCVQLCLSRNFRINTADFLLLSYCLYAIVRMWLSKETYIEPLTIVKWLLLSLLYIAGRLSRNTKVPVVLITVGVGGVLSYLFGFFFNPSHLGVYASTGVCGTICLLLENDKSLFKKILLASLSILLLIILVLSKSRGAFLALFLALAYLWFSSDKYRGLKPNRKRLICALLSGVVLVGAFLLYRIRTGSADVRLLIWSSSGEAFLKAPLFGYSSASVQSLYMPWQAEYFQANPISPFAPFATNHYQTFNEYLHILCEQGLVGFILFALFVVYSFRKCRNRGLVAASISLGTSSFFLYTYDIIPIIILAPLFLGLAISCGINDSCNEIKKEQRPARLLFCAVVLILTFVVCWNVGKSYSSAEKDLKEFIRLPEDSMADRIRPASESIILRNKDMTLLYATHSFRLSPQDHTAVLEQCSKRIIVVEMMSALGNLYLDSSLNDKAERCFILAHYMAPDRMVPKYDLFKFYRDKGDSGKAKEWADIILSSAPRTYNAITIEIKAAAREFVKSSR